MWMDIGARHIKDRAIEGIDFGSIEPSTSCSDKLHVTGAIKWFVWDYNNIGRGIEKNMGLKYYTRCCYEAHS